MSKPLTEIRHLVMLSGGICSWAAAKRVVAKHGIDHTTFLFADTFIEDDDLYRFLIQGSANAVSVELGSKFDMLYGAMPPLERMDERKEFLIALATYAMQEIPCLVWISDGRTPWEVMRDHNCIAKPRMDMCSQELKRELLDAWRDENCNVDVATVYLGLDWTENHRLVRVQALCAPWKYASPMSEEPLLEKSQMLELLQREGIKQPYLYDLGFPHNNCGGFCIKAGQAHFAHLLRMLPARYAYHEAEEEKMRARVGDYSILRDRTGGTTKTLSLRTLRERIEQRTATFDTFDWGGCGCAMPT